MMSEYDLSQEATIKITLGHLVVIWSVLSDKFSSSYFTGELTEEEKRAVWGLEDLCENELVRQNVSSMPERDWNELMEKAREYIKTVPVEFLD